VTIDAETFRPRPRTRASRPATAVEAQEFILVTLRWMTCPVTVEDLLEKARDDWQALNHRTVLAALHTLERDGKASRQGTRWIATRRS
jgi:Fe2+ or Zn2+ uptake regulation protein